MGPTNVIWHLNLTYEMHSLRHAILSPLRSMHSLGGPLGGWREQRDQSRRHNIILVIAWLPTFAILCHVAKVSRQAHMSDKEGSGNVRVEVDIMRSS
jgi:hypothetical protein